MREMHRGRESVEAETVPEGLQTSKGLTIPFLTSTHMNGGREGAYGK